MEYLKSVLNLLKNLWERLGDVVFDQRELRVMLEVGHVRRSAGAEVVDCHHLVATSEKRIGHMRPDEPSSAGQ